MGGDMNGFIWQQLSELQRSMGAMLEAQKTLASAHDKAETKISGKLSKIEDELAEFKQIWHTAKALFYVGLFVASLVLGAVGFMVKEIWDISKPAIKERMSAPIVQVQQAPPPPVIQPRKPADKPGVPAAAASAPGK